MFKEARGLTKVASNTSEHMRIPAERSGKEKLKE